MKTDIIMDHQHSGDSSLSVVSLLFMLLYMVGFGAVASCVAILSGAASLFINFPKIKARFQQIFSKKQPNE